MTSVRKRSDLELGREMDKAVRAYHALGQRRGYLTAELILLPFLPKNVDGGHVCDIHPSRLQSFRMAAERRLLTE